MINQGVYLDQGCPLPGMRLYLCFSRENKARVGGGAIFHFGPPNDHGELFPCGTYHLFRGFPQRSFHVKDLLINPVPEQHGYLERRILTRNSFQSRPVRSKRSTINPPRGLLKKGLDLLKHKCDERRTKGRKGRRKEGRKERRNEGGRTTEKKDTKKAGKQERRNEHTAGHLVSFSIPKQSVI